MFYRLIFLLALHNCFAQESSFEPKRLCLDQNPELEFQEINQSLSLREEFLGDLITQAIRSKSSSRNTIFSQLLKKEITKSTPDRESLIKELAIKMSKFFKPSTINDTDFNFEERFNLAGEYLELSEEEECPYPELFSEKELLRLNSPANVDDDYDDNLINESSIDDDFASFFCDIMQLEKSLLAYEKHSNKRLIDQEFFLKQIVITTSGCDIYLQHYKYYPERKMYEKINLSENFKKIIRIYMNFFDKKFDTILRDICAEHSDYKLNFYLDKNVLMEHMGMVEAMGIEPMSVKLPKTDATCLVSKNS